MSITAPHRKSRPCRRQRRLAASALPPIVHVEDERTAEWFVPDDGGPPRRNTHKAFRAGKYSLVAGTARYCWDVQARSRLSTATYGVAPNLLLYSQRSAAISEGTWRGVIEGTVRGGVWLEGWQVTVTWDIPRSLALVMPPDVAI